MSPKEACTRIEVLIARYKGRREEIESAGKGDQTNKLSRLEDLVGLQGGVLEEIDSLVDLTQ